VVINADSAQVYADLAVLSARPSPEEMRGIQHRLFGEWDGAESCSAADWAARARDVIAEVHARGGVPVLVGGTGLYLRTLLDGIAPSRRSTRRCEMRCAPCRWPKHMSPCKARTRPKPRCFPPQGVEFVFGYPGGAVLPIYDALFGRAASATSSSATKQARPMPPKAMPAPPASPAWCWSPPAPARPMRSPALPTR
jgi:hypothetical protein